MNPALTLGMALVGKLKWQKLPAYWIGQYLVMRYSNLVYYASQLNIYITPKYCFR